MNTLTLPFSIKSVTETGTIEGVVSAFDGLDAVGDTVKRGAYARSLANISASGRKLPVLYQHDARRPIGVWSDLRETSDALVGKAELAMGVRDAQETHALAKQGALTGISIGYDIAPGGAKQEGNRRVLTDLDLWEASLVTFPADPKARVTAIKELTRAQDISDWLRALGVPGAAARRAAGLAWKAIDESDNEAQAEAEIKAVFDASARRIAAIGNSEPEQSLKPFTFDWS